MRQTYFDTGKFKKEALTLFSVSIFIFVLTCISLYAQINNYVLSVISAEPAGYVGYYDKHYASSNDAIVKKIIRVLEEDSAGTYDKEIYVLNKETNTFLSSTGEIPNAAKEQLTSKIHENIILIDDSSCKVIDLNHYKILVKARVPEIINEFIETIATLSMIVLGGTVFALLLLALAHKVFADGSKKRLVATIALVLGVVFSFAGSSLYVQLHTIDRAEQVEAYTLKMDLLAICQNNWELGLTEQTELLDFANSIAKSSQTIKEVTSSVDLQGKAIVPAAAEEIVGIFEIVTDDVAISKLKMNSQISALLMVLLAFMIVYELQKKARLKQRLKGAAVALTENDQRMRTVLMLNGICMSAFSVVNVLRIRQVVMIYWTDNVMILISTIFTFTMIASMLGSYISSIVLKSCKSMKTYSIFTLATGVVSAFLCGVSSNLVIFLAGLMIFNVARALIMMLSDFYSSLISDVNRKDSCQVEFAAGESLGQVVGNIIGGVISIVLSFAVVQTVVAVGFGISLFLCLAFSKSELAVPVVKARGAKSNAVDVLKILLRGDVLLYSICIVLPVSVAYNLVQYKLPLDVAALGLSALVISLAKTMQKVIQSYTGPLFHAISRRMSLVSHAVVYGSISGGLVLFYLLDNSLLGMILAVAAMGLADGAGYYATTKAFREMKALATVQEADRMAGLDIIRKIGGIVSPTLLSVLGNGLALPAMIILAPLVYLAKVRLGKH